MPEASLKEKTAKGLLWGGLSNGVQQLLNLLFGIFLARMLTPDDYGMVGVLAIFVAIAGTLQESGFTAALANKREVKHEDYNAVFWFSVLMGSCMYLVLFCCAPLIARFYDNPELVPLARYLFLGFLISCTATAHHAYLFRNLMVKQKTMAQVPALFISGVVGVLMAYNGMSYWGIATQSLTYIAITNLSYWYFSPWRPTFPVSFTPLKGMFKFSSKLLATNIFTQVNNNILSSLMGYFFTEREVGYYTQSSKWNAMGYSFINGTVNSVAQPILSKVSDDPARQLNVLRKMLRFTAFLSFPAMLGLALVAPELIVITITEKWARCIPMLQMLCVWGAFMPLTMLYSNLIISKGKSDVYMWNTIALSLSQLLVILFSYRYGVAVMIQCFVGLNILWLVVWQTLVWKAIKLSIWMALKDILPFAALATVTMLLASYLTAGIADIYLLFIAKIGIAVMIYFLLMWGSGAAIFRESLQFLKSQVLKK